MTKKLFLLTQHAWPDVEDELKGPFPEDRAYLQLGVYEANKDFTRYLGSGHDICADPMHFALMQQLQTPDCTSPEVRGYKVGDDDRKCEEVVTDVITSVRGVNARLASEHWPLIFGYFGKDVSPYLARAFFSVNQADALIQGYFRRSR